MVRLLAMGLEVETSPVLIVGVGASAGGLEALELLFRDMPTDSGMAFVVQQHLSPDFESRMEELLGRETALRVRTAQHGMLVERDTVYVAPPKVEMILAEGTLLLSERDRDHGLSLPIDHFFRSLAQDAGPRAVAIVLSGTGSDGSRGIRDIAAAGGLVIAQDLDSARFDGMPRSATATGLVKQVLEPTAIAAALAGYARELATGVPADVTPVREEGVAEIMRLLRGEYGIDFSMYKPTTVMRRVERRLRMADSIDIADYGEYLRTHRDELSALYKDLLIGVTRFFRDRDAFRVLDEHVLPQIVENESEEIRIWVPGCATGEEAYSIAILVLERLAQRKDPPRLKIFATDVHRVSLEHASVGRYPAEALRELDEARRQRWFVPDGDDHVRVTKELRERVVFASHNVISDAPFTRLHLVSCRNMLIYLQPPAQKKVLSLFHFGLRTAGVLFLGPSESPGPIEDEFEPISKPWRVYRKRRDVRLIADNRVPLVASQLTAPRRGSMMRLPSRNGPVRDSRLLGIYDLLLSRHMPSALLIDDDHQLVHSFGGAEDLLRVRPGRLSTNVLDLLDPELKGVLSGALERVRRDGRSICYTGLTTQMRGEARQIQVEVEPLVATAGEDADYLIVFRDVAAAAKPPPPGDTVDAERVTRDYIAQLEGELRFTKENLQATIEELETSNEELQATNEELVASNEELQSTNEELHSVNEELQTVNVEHQRKIDQLTELTDDMDNLLQSIDVGVLFLDADFRVRDFTAPISQVFHLLRQDRGRSFADFAHHLSHPNLLDDIADVKRTGVSQSHEVRDRAGGVRLLRILPYRSRGEIAGVVLTLIDVSGLRQAEANVRRLSAIVEHAQDAIFREDVGGAITDWNLGAERLFGWRADEIVGRSTAILVDGDRRQELLDLHARAREGEAVDDLETQRLHKSGRKIDVALTISPIRDEREQMAGTSTIARDITRRRRAEELARQAVEQREHFLALLSHELRNPMAAMLSAAELLADSDVTQRGRRAADVIRRQVRHTSHLLEDLLDISRILHGRLPVKRIPMDLRDIVDDVLDEVRPRAEAAGLELVVRLPHEAVPVRADKTRLKQLLANLLGNAVKYSRAGGKVELALASEARGAVLRVADSGIGLELDDLEKIFEPFYQARGGGVGGGMGLGLALVRAISTAHGGQVSAYSDGPGRGCTCEVVLPRYDGQVASTTADLDAISAVPAAKTQKMVLLVEDQDDNRELLGEALGDAGYLVASARTVAEAIRALESCQPAAAIVDISLPDGNGGEVARRIREMPGGSGVRMIAMTGHGRQSDRDEILAAGFDSHLVKPVSFSTLVSALENREN
jgi:two-component system CheB/CheR fusion protein